MQSVPITTKALSLIAMPWWDVLSLCGLVWDCGMFNV